MSGPRDSILFHADPSRDGGNGGGGSDRDHPAPATPALFEAIYEQLRGLAHRQISHERSKGTLQTTALVHDVYLRLMKDPSVTWESPRHFFGAAAEAMRRILIERARRHAALKHGGGRRLIPMTALGGEGLGIDAFDADPRDAVALLELDEALAELKARDERLSEVVMLRYFAGLSLEETAATTGRSTRTVKRDWVFARAWLLRRLGGNEAPPDR